MVTSIRKCIQLHIKYKEYTMKLFQNIYNILYRYPLSLLTIATIIYLTLFYKSDDKTPTFQHLDKIVHFTMYAGLCSVLWFEYMCSHKRINFTNITLGAVVLPILFSGGLEIAQSTITTTRKGDIYDFLFNTLGVLSAILFSLYVSRPIIKKYHLYKKHIKEE